MRTVDRLPRNCIPCLGQTRVELYTLFIACSFSQNSLSLPFQTPATQATLFRTERTKTIPCPAAHPRIGYIREYPLPPGLDTFRPPHNLVADHCVTWHLVWELTINSFEHYTFLKTFVTRKWVIFNKKWRKTSKGSHPSLFWRKR